MRSRGRVPWLDHDAFPLKPDRGDHGFLEGTRFVRCLREQLVRQCESAPPVLVWTPSADRLVPPSEVGFLKRAIARHRLGRVRHLGKVAVLKSAMLLLVFAVIPSLLLGRVLWIALVPVALFGLLPLVSLVQQRRALSKDPDRVVGEFDMRFAAWVSLQRSPVTYILLGVITIVALVQLTTTVRGAVEAAGNVKPDSLGSEPWRLLTAALLHCGGLHFCLNAGALAVYGRVAEAVTGSARMAIVFVITALAGNVASAVFIPDIPSIGASGAILGLMGFATALILRDPMLRNPAMYDPLLRGLILTGIAGVVGYRFIDNAAHAGGALTGAMLAFVLVPRGCPWSARVGPGQYVLAVVALGLLAAAGGKTVIAILG